jgi:hypothetical protein
MRPLLAVFIALVLLATGFGQAAMAAAMPCAAAHLGADPVVAATDEPSSEPEAQRADAAPCHHQSAPVRDCSDVCKRLCAQVPLILGVSDSPALPMNAQTVAVVASTLLPSVISAPDTPPPIA